MSAVTVSVSAVTAAGNAVLHFAFVPLSLVPGMTIVDNTAGSVLSANATILSIDRVGQTVTMNLPASGAGVGASDSLTFTASDTLDNQTLNTSVQSQEFQSRVYLLFISAAITVLANSPTGQQMGFAGALFANRVSPQFLAQLVLIPSGPNRAQCLLDATVPGGQITDANLTTEINNTFTLISNARHWETT